MSKLKKEEIIEITSSKGFKVLNPDDYTDLNNSNLQFECDKGHSFISNLKAIRDVKNFECPVCAKQTVVKLSQPPKKTGYRIIGFDQATQNFGVSVYDDGKLVFYDVMVFKGDTEGRLVAIARFIDSVCSIWEPDFIMYEDIQLQQGGYNTFKVLAELYGIVTVAIARHNVPHSSVLNKVWQAEFSIAGKDRATQKHNVITKVREMFDINVSDDIADAILIGKYAVLLHKQHTTKKLF